MSDVKLYSRCSHLISDINVSRGVRLTWEAVYDFCPQCTQEILEKQEKLQTTFDETFGGDDSGSPASQP